VSDLQQCGTYGAYQRHRKRGETPCDADRQASATYMADLRQRRPEVVGRDQDRKAARDQAMRRFAEEYPARFRRLLVEELARRGMAS
jgi:hypothetical protein